jgi:hypothetical protein
MAAEVTDPTTRSELRALVREELERARGESRQELLRAGRAAAALYAASLLVYLAVVFLTLMVVYILGTLIEPWIGAAIVGSTLLVTALVVFVRVRASAEEAFRAP